jgi:hypothetical protein
MPLSSLRSIMHLKSPAIYILLLILVCFTAGVISVVLKPEATTPVIQGSPETPTQEAAVEILPTPEDTTNTQTILILGVDHIADPEGRLLAIWLLTLDLHSGQITFLGLPTDLISPRGEVALADSFDLWIPPDYGATFIREIGDLTQTSITGIVALDEHAFAVLLDYMGGVELDGQVLDGASVIGSLRLTYAFPQASLTLQTRILESLRANVGRVGATPELTPLTSLAPIHAYTSPSPPELATLAIPLLPLHPDLISIVNHQSLP